MTMTTKRNRVSGHGWSAWLLQAQRAKRCRGRCCEWQQSADLLVIGILWTRGQRDGRSGARGTQGTFGIANHKHGVQLWVLGRLIARSYKPNAATGVTICTVPVVVDRTTGQQRQTIQRHGCKQRQNHQKGARSLPSLSRRLHTPKNIRIKLSCQFGCDEVDEVGRRRGWEKWCSARSINTSGLVPDAASFQAQTRIEASGGSIERERFCERAAIAGSPWQ